MTESEFIKKYPEFKGKGLWDYPDIDESIEETNKRAKQGLEYKKRGEPGWEDYKLPKPKTEKDVCCYWKIDIEEILDSSFVRKEELTLLKEERDKHFVRKEEVAKEFQHIISIGDDEKWTPDVNIEWDYMKSVIIRSMKRLGLKTEGDE